VEAFGRGELILYGEHMSLCLFDHALLCLPVHQADRVTSHRCLVLLGFDILVKPVNRSGVVFTSNTLGCSNGSAVGQDTFLDIGPLY
jgi:hypothetical protein